MRNITKALGDNAKFYPSYMANHLASDFKFHLDNGIGRILENNSRLTEENAKLREMLEMVIFEAERNFDNSIETESLKEEINQLKDQNNDK